MSDAKHNAMTKPRPADEECFEVFRKVKDEVLDEIHRLNREDDRHGLHEMDKLKHISSYNPILYATEDVAFGRNYFAKIHLGDEKYIHARAHKSHEGKIDFYMLHTTPECAVWDKDTPLEYFID
ncbi:cystatin-A/B [Entomortierella parvispora]|uniref:Cystatin-A/B n=1 Tax=Entomortierella parvispora TaxID=205924 RepID=A0A9P3H250_9FUNG|nr:cystatin-A/B [Entomortierella parvispora]